MALQGQTVDVTLQPMNQQATDTGGPVGRLKSLINGIVKQITRTDTGAALRVEKRDGFAVLPSTVRDPSTGTVSAKTLTTQPGLLTTYRTQLLAVFLAAPFILSEAAGCWESPTYTCPTQVLRERGVYQGNALILTEDQARIGSRTMFVMVERDSPTTSRITYEVIDDDGTVIRSPVLFAAAGATDLLAKVTTDGTRFWLVLSNTVFAGLIDAVVFDTNGVILGSASSSLTTVPFAAGTWWDVTADTTQLTAGVFVVQKNAGGAGVTFTRFVWTGSAVTSAQTSQAAFLCTTGRVAFLRNNTGDGNLYLTTVTGAGPFAVNVWQATSPGAGTFANGHQYVVNAAAAVSPFQITGIAGTTAPTNNPDLTVFLSFLDATPTPQLNFSEIRTVTFAGVTTLQRTQRGLTAVSRPFALSGAHYVVAYYRSNPLNGFTQIAQSTYFLISLASYQVCGRWEYGTAYADATDTATTTYYLSLSSPILSADLGIHVALAYRAQSSVVKFISGGNTQGGLFFGSDVVGIKDYSFGPDFGQALEVGGELLIPGPECSSYTGTKFSENGMSLVPEISNAVPGAGGLLNPLYKYQYVAVAEWTNDNGDRVRGPAGPPVNIALAGGQNRVTLTGYNIHTTRKTNVLISVYRTVILGGSGAPLVGGLQSSIHYKITASLKASAFTGPVVYNDDTSNTWTLVDDMSDVIAAQNESLYTDRGSLDRFPAPPFSTGTQAFGRAFVVGPDNAVWFSGEKTETEATWFNPSFRIPLPTHEKVKAIRQLDNFLLVLCEKSDVFSIPAGPFPDAAGNGSIPSPTLLPFSNGCTGFAEVTDQGVMYSSAQGGIWMITRDLRNVFVGAPVQNDTANAAVIASASDDKQRAMFALTTGAMLVYDQVTNVWSKWQVDAAAVPSVTGLTSHKGRFVYSGFSAGNTPAVLRQFLGLYFDQTAAGGSVAIITQVLTAFIRLGGIRNYKRVWQTQMQGTWLGDHDLAASVYNDDDAVNPTATYAWTPPVPASPPAAIVFDLPPKVELCTTVAYLIQDSFPRGPTQGFAMEVLSFFVGLEKGLGRLPATSSIKPT